MAITLIDFRYSCIRNFILVGYTIPADFGNEVTVKSGHYFVRRYYVWEARFNYKVTRTIPRGKDIPEQPVSLPKKKKSYKSRNRKN
jgi:hypothetical protein